MFSSLVKSTVEEIRARFDADVERFSNLETGQTARVDAARVLELIAEAATVTTPGARDLLDVGCGAGNYALKVLARLPGLSVTLVDLSRPMLDRASARVGAVATDTVRTEQADIRALDTGAESVDLITAAAVLHHLRDEEEWRAVFRKFHRALRPGGSLWIAALSRHDFPGGQRRMQRRYGEYRAGLPGPADRDAGLAYTEKEATPRSLGFQVDTLREVGFTGIEILHKNACMAAFGAVKARV